MRGKYICFTYILVFGGQGVDDKLGHIHFLSLDSAFKIEL